MSEATGAKFSLLPPDNASGNFVKVTQRVPVKITINNIDKYRNIFKSRSQCIHYCKNKIIFMSAKGIAKFIIVATTVSAAVMELIDTSIVNVALTDMAGSLGVSIEDISWVITSYAIANVIIIPLTGFLAEYFGRKNYYIASMIIFTFASYMCAQSTGLVEISHLEICTRCWRRCIALYITGDFI